MLKIKGYTAILVIFSVACIGIATISHPNHINALINKNNNNTGNSNSTTTTIATDKLITNILAKNLEDHLKKAGAYLRNNKQITSSEKCILCAFTQPNIKHVTWNT